jgi:hypothetical protein
VGGSLSYDREMARADLHLKIELDMNEDERPERLAAEICRMIRKVYGVRAAEISSLIENGPVEKRFEKKSLGEKAQGR